MNEIEVCNKEAVRSIATPVSQREGNKKWIKITKILVSNLLLVNKKDQLSPKAWQQITTLSITPHISKYPIWPGIQFIPLHYDLQKKKQDCSLSHTNKCATRFPYEFRYIKLITENGIEKQL